MCMVMRRNVVEFSRESGTTVNWFAVGQINYAQLKRDIQMLVDYWFEVTTFPDCPQD